MSGTHDVVTREADEERIAACLEACAGLSTEALKNGVIHKMISTLDSANNALEQWAAMAIAGVPAGFTPVIVGLPQIGQDHQQIIEKRGSEISVIAWRPIPGESVGSPDYQGQADSPSIAEPKPPGGERVAS
ncbi:hypothetical protein [Paraburkholderia kururiensis]|uniref:hypothetical protein n=1 Tax=Paraburkholderia kururiensis TaxID=984307 RepID=UPI0005A61F5D|nr:hypothetical protein [Paraburkholderia kururiensis]